MPLSQEYLGGRKNLFETEMSNPGEMPPSPLEDPGLINLLTRMQLLVTIAKDVQEPSRKGLGT